MELLTEFCPARDPGCLEEAANRVEAGEVIAVPTDTVYGLVCRYDRESAILELYRVKERPPEKALPVLVGEVAQLAAVAQTPIPPLAQRLIRRHWPGPLSLVLEARPGLPSALTAGGETVAVRLPDHPFVRDLARRVGPLASSSANRSGAGECRSAREVYEQLAGRVPLIVDGGVAPGGQASTVVDLSGVRPRILREGPIGEAVRAELAQVAPGSRA